MEKGKYILIEGGEGCGKSTQAERLYDYFIKIKLRVIKSREPGGIKEAEEIRKILLDPENHLSPLGEVFLFEAAREIFFREVVIPNLERGVHVISDRSGFSTEAYQGYGGGFDLEEIRRLNKLATGGVRPDLAFIINIDSNKGLERELKPDRFANKGPEYHTRVNSGYLEIAQRESDICVAIPYIENGAEEMHKQIVEQIRKRLRLFH